MFLFWEWLDLIIVSEGNELEEYFEVQALYFIFLKHYPGNYSLQLRAILSYQLPYDNSCIFETAEKRSETSFTKLVDVRDDGITECAQTTSTNCTALGNATCANYINCATLLYYC